MSSCPPPPFSFSRALELRCRLWPPSTVRDLPHAGLKAAPPIVRPPSRRFKGCTACRPPSPSPRRSGDLSAPSPCRAAPPSPPMLMPRRPEAPRRPAWRREPRHRRHTGRNNQFRYARAPRHRLGLPYSRGPLGSWVVRPQAESVGQKAGLVLLHFSF
jgi:hypothetical protein